MPLDDDIEYPTFEVPIDEQFMSVRHDDMPVYISILRNTLSMGHFVVISHGSGGSYIGQLTRWHNDAAHSQHFVQVVPHLPLYSRSTLQYIGSPTLLPRAVTHFSCQNVTEVFRTNHVAVVSISDIIGLAFIFLADNVTNSMNHLQGMQNAFIIRFKYCRGTHTLLPLNEDSFHSFPDMHPSHVEYWCECYGRSIFTSINYLRQEIWLVLCRYKQSQGMFPKYTISFFFQQFLPSIYAMRCRPLESYHNNVLFWTLNKELRSTSYIEWYQLNSNTYIFHSIQKKKLVV